MNSRGLRPAQPSAHGFTLIELIVVIVVLSVLAATALPKFLEMRRDARLAVLEAVKGTLFSAMEQGRVKCHLTPACSTDALYSEPVLAPSGKLVRLKYGYPSSIEIAPYHGVKEWLTLSGSLTLTEALSPNRTVISVDDAADPSTCQVSYSTSAMSAPTQRPTITVLSTGC